MDLLWRLVDYFQEHPLVGLAAVVGLVFLNFALNRKSPLSRDLDKRLEQLRKERGDIYNKLRPPQ